MIIFHEENKEFHLCNTSISYIINILENGHLGHLYFGKVIHGENFSNLMPSRAATLAPAQFKNNLDFTLETKRLEYPCYGTGDYRSPAYEITYPSGNRISDFKYLNHKIYNGKLALKELPHLHGNDCETLEITLEDQVTKMKMVICYHIFNNLPVISREVKFTNNAAQRIVLEKAMSMSLDLFDNKFDVTTLDGAWSRERHIHKRALSYGKISVSSSRGTSSASHNPFLALSTKNATEETGEVFGFSLIYSGNHEFSAEVDCYDITRVMCGINSFEFNWTLEQNETFQTPEAVMVYSSNGFSGMTNSFHDLVRNNLLRGVWSNKDRPILINNWEATYFNFNEESLVNIATKAKTLGIELFVLDDGWFGKRNDDTTSLGDWFVNLNKLPNGIKGISKRIHALDMKFGLWFEPEMVNEISDLYLAHHEWTISTPNRNKSYGRNQFVLDYTNNDVVDYIYTVMSDTLEEGSVDYVKWDMNRNITESYSAILPSHRQKEFFHRYILGVYNLYERLTNRFPNILFESCASGGARFDLGMLYYAPQAWTSDNTDAIARLDIQAGTSMLYPLSTMGSHVSACPNHQLRRTTSLDTRANVAYYGTFGYELDVTKLSDIDLKIIKNQVSFFKEQRTLIRTGDFYRLEIGENGIYAFMVVSKDKSKAMFSYYKVLANSNPTTKKIKLCGLDPNAKYNITNRKSSYGDELMNFGFITEQEFTGVLQEASTKGVCTSGNDAGDFTSYTYVLKKESK